MSYHSTKPKEDNGKWVVVTKWSSGKVKISRFDTKEEAEDYYKKNRQHP